MHDVAGGKKSVRASAQTPARRKKKFLGTQAVVVHGRSTELKGLEDWRAIARRPASDARADASFFAVRGEERRSLRGIGERGRGGGRQLHFRRELRHVGARNG